jgi:phage terminase large subunit
VPALPALDPVEVASAPDIDLAVQQELRRRLNLFDAIEDGGADADLIKAFARRDVVFWANNFAVTYDPRINSLLPFVLWPRQVDYLRFLEQALTDRHDIVCEKSRDVGVSYLNCLFAVHRWLYVPGFKSTFCANKFDQVDMRGNPDAIFEKLRIILRGLPKWMMPEGFNFSVHVPEGRLINPENRNVVTGEGGDNAGRGGRSSVYFIDEAAFVRSAASVNAATSANAECRAWCSTVNGTGNFFAELAQSQRVPVFRFHWRDDPRKSEAWAEEQKRRVGDVTFAAEYDIDYGASVEGLVIQNVWLEAAVELRRRLADRVPPGTRARCGLDVGGGKAESALIIRKGPLVLPPVIWPTADTTDVAHNALAEARQHGAMLLNFDSVGVGAGVAATLSRADVSAIAITGVNVGIPPSKRVWPDGRTSVEMFDNLKAELWWCAREAFRRSYQLLRFLDGYTEDAFNHPLEDVVLMCDDLTLRRQLNTPKWFKTETGKIFIERKHQLASRNVKSPDRAEGFVLTYFEPVTSFYIGEL